MAVNFSDWIKIKLRTFKRFLKRNMTPTWAKHFSYQVFAFIVSVLMVLGVADYAVTKSYEERKLSFVDNFTVTVHTGAYGTPINSVDFIVASIENGAEIIELDIRQRPDGTLVMSNDLVVTNNDGVPLEEALELLKGESIKINFDVKEIRILNALHKLVVEYNLGERAFLTGIETVNVKAVMESDCSNMEYYLNYKPSRVKAFSDDYRQKIIEMLEDTGAVGLNCNYKYVNSQVSSMLHNRGYKLSVSIVDRERTVKKVLVTKPDNITTKDPQMIERVISNWGK